MEYRVAVDIGGTFTDLVAVEEGTGSLIETKVLTTPRAPEKGVLDAAEASRIPAGGVAHFLHGTTLVINALTERRGARIALLTTAGFGDLLEIQRCNRRDMYNLRYAKPQPFVPRSRVWEVRERVTAGGEVLVPLNEEDIRSAGRACVAAGAEAVAVCFLNAYANIRHEVRCREILRELLPDIPLTLSHELTREWREYERCSTAALNAYVQPLMSTYLAGLDAALTARGIRGPRHVMQSNGRVTTFLGAAKHPITLVESGPVAGVIGAAAAAAVLGISDLISLDIGGTTAKASLIRGGWPTLHTDYYIERDRVRSGYPLKIPTVDIVEAGAGGGSIARLDAGGRLLVGPESAGADPGPACYGRGGADPTVTDAFLVTGVLDPDYFLGGSLPLRVEAAVEVYERLAHALRASLEDTALGVIRLATTNMANTLRLVSVHRGHDPRNLALLAMGGGGPMHASVLAREMGMRLVIVPPRAGVFSAFGMLHSDVGLDLIRTRLARLDDPRAQAIIASVFEEMVGDARDALTASGVNEAAAAFTMSLDMRYKGQEHTVEVGVPPNGNAASLAARFHEAHERRYTFRLADPVEVVNFRLAAVVAQTRPAPVKTQPSASPEPVGFRAVWFSASPARTPIFRRDRLGAGTVIHGPAVIEEAATTTVVLPGDRLEVHASGSLLIHIGGAQ
jgi:N-methylhydantoinase A